MKQRRIWRLGVVLAIAALSVSACSQLSNAPSTPKKSTATPGVAGALTTAGAQPSTASVGPAAAAGTTAAPAAGEHTRCSSVAAWTTEPDDGGLTLSPAELSRVRVGRHACYDRVVFDIDGPEPVGFNAAYVPVVRADGSGEEVPVAGAAALQVVVRAPFLGSDDPASWQDMPRAGDNLVAPSHLSGWNALRGVAFAGSFEGQTTMAVGVQERRAFRVWTLGSAHGQRVILDIAH
jgi:hypothetical protein